MIFSGLAYSRLATNRICQSVFQQYNCDPTFTLHSRLSCREGTGYHVR